MAPDTPHADVDVDLSSPRHVHVVGVGGPGMNAVAILLARMGHSVTGSDMQRSPVIDTLRTFGVDARVGHDAAHVDGADYVTYSTAIPPTNVELVASRAAGTPTVHRSAMLRAISAAHRSIGVCGTHGKTTTTALLTAMLKGAGRDPSFYIGADVPQFGSGADIGTDGSLIIECDESDGTADAIVLTAAVLTNVDRDHLDRFGDLQGLEDEFVRILRRIDGPLVVCGDDESAMRVADRAGRVPTITYGFGPANDVVVGQPRSHGAGTTFTVTADGRTVTVDLPLRGEHNALNCAAAMVMAAEQGIDPAVAAGAVADFGGVDRRFVESGNAHGALLIDDYAHLPAEISAVLRAARSHPARSGRVVAVFQPNRYHRIAHMAGEYAECFADADMVFITDIYASGTTPIKGVTGELVVNAVRSAHESVVWARTREELVRSVRAVLQPGDVCISMGCGDIAEFPRQLTESR